ncbi:glycosyltransferase family 4 protein [bacterium]|nr:glycosyltransferase family 4 protein [bacterium]
MSVKRNILFVTCWYPKNGSSEGIFIKRHAEVLKKAGHSISIFIIRIGKGPDLYKKRITESTTEDGINLIECELKSKAWKFIYTIYPLLRFLLRKEIKSFSPKYDVVQSNVMHPSSIIGHSISKRTKSPHVVIEHHSRLPFYLDHFVFRWGIRRVYRKAAALIFVSDFLRSMVTSKYAHPRTFVVPNVIDKKVFRNLSLNSREDGKLKILAIANWNKGKYVVKRPDLILFALNGLKDQFEIEMEFIGPGNNIDELRRTSDSLGLNCTFSLEQDTAYIMKRLNEVDYFFHASEIETFSMVVVEALSVGVPVLVSNVGAIPEHITPENGVLVENTNEAWKNGALEITHRSYSRKEISEDMEDRYSSDVVAKKLNHVYDIVLNEVA